MTEVPLARRRKKVFRSVSMVAVVTLAIAALTSCEPPPYPYLTRVPNVLGEYSGRYLDETFTVTRTSNVHYSTADDLAGNPVDLALDIYQPDGDTATARPAIILVHGGGFKILNKREQVIVDQANHFAARGYVVIAIDYRLLANENCGNLGGVITEASGCITAASAAISDGSAAVRWARLNAATYRIDPGRIAMMGDSAGAIISIGVGLFAGATNEYMDNLAAGKPQNPITVALQQGAPPNESNPGAEANINSWVSFSGGFPSQMTAISLPQLVADNWPDDPPGPGLFFHGTADNQVPYAWGETLRDQLIAIDCPVIWEGFPGLGHVGSLWTNQKQTILDESTSFFYLTLRLDQI